MRESICAVVAVFVVAGMLVSDAAAQSVTAPASQTIVAAGQDWATTRFQKPIDMSQWTDISWWAYANDQPLVQLNSVTYGACTGGGSTSSCFKATTASADNNVWILETGNPPSSRVGKTGDNFPIDANTYKTVAVRMRINSGSCPYLNPPFTCTASFYWDKGSLYDSPSTGTRTNSIFTYDGWQIYLIDLTTIGYSGGTALAPWTGNIGDLRLNLTAISGVPVEIDWIRLVPNNLTSQTITWSGFSGSVDVYLDSNTTATDGNLGLIVKNGPNTTLPARNVSGGSYSVQPGMLAPGDYYVEVCPTGTDPTSGSSGCKYSPGYYRVNDAPTFAFSSPSPEGSSDDFATVQLNQAWDMTSTSQVDYHVNVSGLTATTIAAVDETGNSLGNVNVLQGTSLVAGQTGYADPYMYFLWYDGDGRGRYKTPAASRYHILTLEMGVPDKPRDINLGSIVRMVWQIQGEAPRENVSNDLIFNSRAGVNVMSKIITSMRTCSPSATEWNHCLRLETDPGASPSTTGWTGNIENFRFDAHEYSPATAFYIKKLKLAANEKTVNNQYTIQWTYTDLLAPGTPTLTLYYDTDLDPSSGLTQIVTGLNPAILSSYTWNTAGVPNGTYYIYASFSDGLNTNAAYSRWPIIADSSSTSALLPRIALSRRRLDFGGNDNGRLVGDPQTVTVTISGTGGTSVQWRATSSDPSVLVSPSTGTGSGTFNVSIRSSTIYPDNLQGDYYVTMEESTPGTTSNSAQYIRVFFQMYPKIGTLPAYGAFDTPVDGTTGMQGSFAVTGWALDDIGIDRVEIWRDSVAGETTPVYAGPGPGTGKIFIARPLFISGSRPDVEAAYPTLPQSYRSGGGDLLLSWGLYNQGNATYKLYAFGFDKEGNSTTLGTKTITVSNATATKPFGALDTPTYGQTVTGSFWNYGWALTPNGSPTCTITNGNVWMGIDSAALVTVNYGDPRGDIAASFPGFSNGNNSGGAYFINTSALSNGTHQIGWLVTDSCGRTDGIGSRFFSVVNGAADARAEAEPAPDSAAVAARAATSVSSGVDLDPIGVRTNLGSWQWVSPNAAGDHIVEVAEGQRVEVQLPGQGEASYEGSHVVGGGRRAIPLGSSLVAQSGIYYWQPAAGFLGNYDLVFTPREGSSSAVRVRVVVGPPMRAMIDTPLPGEVVDSTFVLAGWAIDLAARDGAGIDTVHVWAYPAGGGKPTLRQAQGRPEPRRRAKFLGIAEHGDARPDVERVYGAAFADSSYSLVVHSLPPGSYDIVVYPHRAKTGTFDGAQVVRVTVR